MGREGRQTTDESNAFARLGPMEGASQFFGWGAHASRVWVSASRRDPRGLFSFRRVLRSAAWDGKAVPEEPGGTPGSARQRRTLPIQKDERRQVAVVVRLFSNPHLELFPLADTEDERGQQLRDSLEIRQGNDLHRRMHVPIG